MKVNFICIKKLRWIVMLTVQRRCRSSTVHHVPLSAALPGTADQEDGQTSPWWRGVRARRRPPRGSTKWCDLFAAGRRSVGAGDDVWPTRQGALVSSSWHVDDGDDRGTRDHTSNAPDNSQQTPSIKPVIP